LVVLPTTAPATDWLGSVEGFVEVEGERRGGGGGSAAGGGGGGGGGNNNKRKAEAAAAAGEGEEAAAEAARLREELRDAHAEVVKWKKLHAELHAFCVEEVLENPPPS
jgi:hypothetical protein